MKITEEDGKIIAYSCDEMNRSWPIDDESNDDNIYLFDKCIFNKTATDRVTSKFYKNILVNRHLKEFTAITNKGTILIAREDTLGDYEWGLIINSRTQCIGEEENTFARAMKDIKTTSDFLAQLAVFANKHAK